MSHGPYRYWVDDEDHVYRSRVGATWAMEIRWPNGSWQPYDDYVRVLENASSVSDTLPGETRGFRAVLTEVAAVLRFDPNEPRDDHGRWTDGGGTSRPAPSSDVVPGDKEKFLDLKAAYAIENNKLLAQLDTPDSPEAQASADKLKAIVKQMYTLHVDPGGVEGIGQPGGPRDIVVVGAGPGGLSAGINAGTEGMDTLVLDASVSPGGQSKYSSRIENYAGFPIGISGEKLATNMFSQVERVGAEAKLGVKVMSMTYNEQTGLKTLSLSNGDTVTTRAVVVAGGVEFHKMNFPGEDSPSVIYGNAKMLAVAGRGKPVVIVGGSNGAAQAALGAAQTAEHVAILSRSPITKGMSDYQVQAIRNNPKISVLEGAEVDHVTTDPSRLMRNVVTKDGREIPASVLGVFIGGAPATKWLPSSVALDHGKVKIGHDFQTSIPGVYAVGDIRSDSVSRIGGAVGEGQLAVRNIIVDYLPTTGQAKAARRRRASDITQWNTLVDAAFAADDAFPFLGQTMEPTEDDR